jgi:GNAT superfamily N-acetyltransferase
MIEVYKEYEGNNLSKYILDYIKKYAKQLGATIITLRVDYGLGYTERNTNSYLDKIYIKNGFNYYFTDKECELDDTKGLGTMYFIV